MTAVHPLWAIEGGRFTLEGEGFDVEAGLPQVRVGAQSARLAAASSTALTVIVPYGLEGGQTAVRIDELPGETAFVEIGAPLVNGVHHVDSPAYDRHGNLYVTFSGSRGQQAPVAIFVVRPDGTREVRRVENRAFMPHELVRLFRAAGFVDVALYGPDAKPFERTSRRVIVVGTRGD